MNTIAKNPNHYAEPTSFNQMIEDLLSPTNWQWPSLQMRSLPIDVVELERSLVIKAMVPGVEPNDIDIALEDNILTIKGTTQNDHELEEAKVFHQEIRYGAFTKSVRLPDGLNLDGVVAEFHNGLVTITIPKMEQPKPKQIKISIANSEKSEVTPAVSRSNPSCTN